MLNQALLIITYMLLFSSALSLVAIGGMFSERSGVINIGLEGIMAVGGCIGVLVLRALTDANAPGAVIVIVTILAAIVAGTLYSLLLAVVCINFKADQTLVGTALNILATALSIIVTKRISTSSSTSIGFENKLFNTIFDYGIGTFSISIFFYIAIAVVIIAYIALYKFKFGLRLRACGENPSAADSVGINVVKYRYIGVLISGALGGLGALAYVIPAQAFWNADVGVAGFGFLALAIMIFGQWKPLRIFIISIIFSLFISMSYIYFGFFEQFGIILDSSKGVTADLFKMIPYIASLVLLAFSSKKSRAPKSEGIPYDKSVR